MFLVSVKTSSVPCIALCCWQKQLSYDDHWVGRSWETSWNPRCTGLLWRETVRFIFTELNSIKQVAYHLVMFDVGAHSFPRKTLPNSAG